MKALVSCEFSGKVRDALIARGIDAMSCDLLPTERPGPHYQGDVRDILDQPWDILVAHPPCTYLANSGAKHLYVGGKKENGLAMERWYSLDAAARFFRLHLEARHIPRRVIENPIPHRHAVTRIGRKADQIVQPWQFGHKEMKATCLWLEGVEPIKPTNIVGPPPVDGMERRAWAKVHRAPPSADRWKIRSETYDGIAEALAEHLSLNARTQDGGENA